MPKVLQINSVVNKGSTGRIAEQIGKLIIKSGWDSYIAFGRDSGESASKNIKIGSSLDNKLHLIESRVFDNHGLSSRNATKTLIKDINNIKPDIIHLHNLHGYYLNFKILFNYFSKVKIPIVWTLHDCWAFTGHCSYFSDIDCNKWQSECNSCPKKGNYPKSVFFDNSKRNYYLKKEVFNSVDINFVTVSFWLESLVRKSFLENNNIRVICNGVDSNIFKIQEKNNLLLEKYNFKGKTVLLAASTSWSKQKGYDDYIKLAEKLSNDELIVLIGLPNKLQANLPKNIIGVSRTESVFELAAWYNTTDIVLNLSTQETFGLTSVEGFMCGKPTIVYNTTASPELIFDDVLGEVVESGQIGEVYNAINIIKNKGDNSLKIRETAIRNFDSKNQYLKYIELYKNLLLLR
jgi:putative colanic acid biosynthesis glycosyltransferase